MAETSVNQKHRASEKQVLAIKIAVVFVAVVILFMITSSIVILARRSDDTILHGVRIEQIDVGGKTVLYLTLEINY